MLLVVARLVLLMVAGADGGRSMMRVMAGVVMLVVAGVMLVVGRGSADIGSRGSADAGGRGSAAGDGCGASSTAGGVCMKLEDVFPFHFFF